MRIDPLIYLSEAIQSAVEAAVRAALVVIPAAPVDGRWRRSTTRRARRRLSQPTSPEPGARPRYGRPVSRIVEDNPGESRFELRDDGALVGWSEYRPAGDSVIVAHTEIDERREGEGLGSVLVRATLDHIRASGKTVIPTCAFTAEYIRRHPEYVDLVAPSLRGQFASSEPAAYDVAVSWQVYLSGEIHTDWRERIEQRRRGSRARRPVHRSGDRPRRLRRGRARRSSASRRARSGTTTSGPGSTPSARAR